MKLIRKEKSPPSVSKHTLTAEELRFIDIVKLVFKLEHKRSVPRGMVTKKTNNISFARGVDADGGRKAVPARFTRKQVEDELARKGIITLKQGVTNTSGPKPVFMSINFRKLKEYL